MSKKAALLIALILLALGMICGITVAFFSRSVIAENVITFGSVNLKLYETYVDDLGTEVEFNPATVDNVTSAGIQKRIFRVENTGKNPMYVRLHFKICGTTSEGEPFQTTEYLTVSQSLGEWRKKEDWFYYPVVVNPNEKTKELITEVIFDIDELTKKYPGSNYELSVYAQGVQSENNGTEVWNVQGWPEL